MFHIIIIMDTHVAKWEFYSNDAMLAASAILKHRGVRHDIVTDKAPAK